MEALRVELAAVGPTQEVVSKSQIAFRRTRTVARAWAPGQYLGRGLLVLTLDFAERDPSPRWKEVVEPRPGHVTHHLELHGPEDLDDEVRSWLRRAWEAAGCHARSRPSMRMALPRTILWTTSAGRWPITFSATSLVWGQVESVWG